MVFAKTVREQIVEVSADNSVDEQAFGRLHLLAVADKGIAAVEIVEHIDCLAAVEMTDHISYLANNIFACVGNTVVVVWAE